MPLDIGGGNSTSIVEESYAKLKEHLGIGEPVRYLGESFRIIRVDEAVQRRLGCCCVPINAGAPPVSEPQPTPDTRVDAWGITWKQLWYSDEGYYWEPCGHPLANAELADLEKHSWPDPEHPAISAGLAEEVRRLHEESDCAIMADPVFKSLWEVAYMLRGFEQMMMDLVVDPAFADALLSKILEINITATGRFLDAVGGHIHVLRTADDLATQKGLLMSRDMFRERLMPYYKKYFDFVKSKTEAKIFYHSCGNVTNLIDDLAEIGVDILNPVQVSAIGDTAELKRRVRGRMALWGGIDTQHVLPQGSPGDVKEEVRRRIRDLASGGGYVAAAVHNIQADVPPENILAMAEAVREHGAYPLVA